MRLKVDADPNVVDSYIEIGGGQCELRVPSGDETGLKVNRAFTVGVGAITDLTIDFDLRKSIVEPPGQESDPAVCDGQAYLLKPVLRVVINGQTGQIGGKVPLSWWKITLAIVVAVAVIVAILILMNQGGGAP